MTKAIDLARYVNKLSDTPIARLLELAEDIKALQKENKDLQKQLRKKDIQIKGLKTRIKNLRKK